MGTKSTEIVILGEDEIWADFDTLASKETFRRNRAVHHHSHFVRGRHRSSGDGSQSCGACYHGGGGGCVLCYTAAGGEGKGVA